MAAVVVAAAAATELNQRTASSVLMCLHHTETNRNFPANTLKHLSVKRDNP